MLNYLWGMMIIIGIMYAAFNGTIGNVTTAAIESAKEAIQLCITMLGVMGMWSGIMKIAEEAGIIKAATKKIYPFIRYLFPAIPKENKANEYISTNIIANILGLGWAATPAGLKAMKSLDELNGYKKSASTAMCTFLIVNISSLQLIPINMIAYRTQYGSANPTLIVAPAIITTVISTIAGMIFAKVAERVAKCK